MAPLFFGSAADTLVVIREASGGKFRREWSLRRFQLSVLPEIDEFVSGANMAQGAVTNDLLVAVASLKAVAEQLAVWTPVPTNPTPAPASTK